MAEDQIINRDAPEPADGRKALISHWCGKIEASKGHFEDDFKAIRADMEFANKGGDKEQIEAGSYIANLVLRHVNRKVADLYARNPRAVARRKPRLEHVLWDGDPASLAMAQEGLLMGVMDPNAMALMAEVQEVKARRTMLDRTGKTLEHLFHHFLDEQEPSFKISAKQLVRRVVTTDVGYVKLEFQRLMELSPEVETEIANVAEQLKLIEAISADIADGEIEEDSARAEELRTTLAALQAQREIITHEGPVFSFPRATEIIIDPHCRQIKGFVGAWWIAHEMQMSPDRVKQVYGIDVRSGYTQYHPHQLGTKLSEASFSTGKPVEGHVMVWEVQCKRTGTVFAIADGYGDYLAAPAQPAIQLERFYNVFSLQFNATESDKSPYSPSDVRLLRDPQLEHNRARQGLREHRVANRPKYVTSKGKLDGEDIKNLGSTLAHAVIELNALSPGEKSGDLLQPLKQHPIDPLMYDTAPSMGDILQTTGSQEANLGPTAGATATESSIAESSRVSSVASNVDDLDDLLTELARATSQAMLQHMSLQQVQKIVGPGAAWPEFTSEEIADEIYLTIKAGSAGRPNKAQELANLERAGPIILQTPGINPAWFARKVLERLDDADLDLDEALVEGMPSIIALNAAAGRPQPAAGAGEGPDSDPAQQGDKGSGNAPRADRNEQGAQPEYPTGV